jgi:hypothetical protein
MRRLLPRRWRRRRERRGGESAQSLEEDEDKKMGEKELLVGIQARCVIFDAVEEGGK